MSIMWISSHIGLHIERRVMLCTVLTISQVYAGLIGRRFTQLKKRFTSNEQAFFIGALNERKYTENERYINLKVKEKCIPFNIDTGAHDNVVLESICKKKCILCGSKKSI